MRRWVWLLLLGAGLVSCSTRTIVVAPEEMSKLNDSKWTIESEPGSQSPSPK